MEYYTLVDGRGMWRPLWDKRESRYSSGSVQGSSASPVESLHMKRKSQDYSFFKALGTTYLYIFLSLKIKPHPIKMDGVYSLYYI